MVAHGWPPDENGGTQLYGRALSASLRAGGHEVAVFAANPATGAASHRVDGTVERWFRPTRSSARLGRTNRRAEAAFGAALERVRPDVVHVLHLLFLSPGVVEVARRRRLPVVISLNDHWFLCPLAHLSPDRSHRCRGPLWGAACAWHTDRSAAGLTRLPAHLARPSRMRAALRGAQALVAPSAFVADRFAEFGVGAVEVVPYGLEGEPVEAVRPVRAGGLRVGFLGAFHEAKGADLVVKAFVGVRAPEARLTLRGQIDKPAYRDRVRALAERDARIDVGGHLPAAEVHAFLGSIDVMVIPTRVHETFCRVAHEALRARVPVLASRRGALPEVVIDGVNGWLFDPDDPADLASHLDRLARDPGRARRLDRFPAIKTMDEHAAEMGSVYQRAMATVRA